ncbi:MAG: hypothetical protein PHO64_14545, partial [Thiomonas sp.]|nr:hypothetical protein [Thiomonas sp.]
MPATAQKIVNRPTASAVPPLRTRHTPDATRPANATGLAYVKSSPHAARFSGLIKQPAAARPARDIPVLATAPRAASRQTAAENTAVAADASQPSLPTTARAASPLPPASAASPTPVNPAPAGTASAIATGGAGAAAMRAAADKAGSEALPPVLHTPPTPATGGSLGRIASAPPSAPQAQALLQAQRILADCARNEARVSHLAVARQQALHLHLAGRRALLFGLFAHSVASVRAAVLNRKFRLMDATAR